MKEEINGSRRRLDGGSSRCYGLRMLSKRLPKRKLFHEPPNGRNEGIIFFITVCGKVRGENQFCNPALGPIIIDSIKWRHSQGKWHCILAILMPDHIHLLLQFPLDQPFARSIRNWKNWLARMHGVNWQDNFFDHRLRRDESLEDKYNYILQNPVRAKLIDRVNDWPYVWRSETPSADEPSAATKMQSR